MLDFFFYSFLFAVTAWVHVNVLTEPDMILGWLPNFTIDHNFPEWLRRILWACEYCVSGQIALWGYLLFPRYSVLEHICIIAMTIFFTECLFRLMRLWD